MPSSSAQSVARPTALQTAKDREFHKYHNPADASQVPAASVASVPRSSHDVALTSFAQLGALRLNAKRCMISLFDHSSQHIIAEATRTLSLQSDDIHEPDDELWLGVTDLEKSGGICQFVVDLPTNFGLTHSTGGRGDVYIIPDLTKDARFADKGFVTSKPFARFYAGVPICSPKGYYIGSYCILDDRPRDTVSDHALQFMRDMARTVMEHLSLTRAREEHRRGERMVRGLGSFHGGRKNLSDWQPSAGFDATVDDGNYNLASSGFDENRHVDIDQGSRHHQIKVDDSPGTTSEPSVLPSKIALPAISAPNRRLRSIERYPRSTGSRDVSPSTLSEPRGVSPKPNLSTLPPNQVSIHTAKVPNDTLSTGVKLAFSRAANIIRESIEVEGSVFFDASISSYSGLVQGSISGIPDNAWSEAASSSAGSPSEEGDAASVNRGRRPKSPSDSENGGYAGILGYSTARFSSINNDAPPLEFETMSEDVLKRLVKRFPNGKIFHFSEDGLISSGSSSEDDYRWSSTGHHNDPKPVRRKVKTYSGKIESESMNKIFPGVRCLALVPLWDSNRERWFSVGFLWTTSPKRVFTLESELSYLAVFGNTIMADVARLDATASDKAKSDLLGSISHELRSPLHGILGSVELLEDSISNTHQHDLVYSIETCGITLLHTINHLLEYSRINHSYELYKDIKKTERRRKRSDNQALKSLARSSDSADIATITEEVMDVVTAGHHKLAATSILDDVSYIPPSRISEQNDPYPFAATFGSKMKSSPLSNVDVSLDISSNFDWNFKTQSGAWQRLVMNLFSNSLKYMDKERGFVKVTLRQEVLPSKHKNSPKQSRVVLNVTDTGRGMSQEYLKQRLFTPFAQEDHLAPGTGLGLSIVRQIVSSLGGKIAVTSLKDIGTDIKVSVPMTQDPQPSPTVDEVHDISFIAEQTRGLGVAILGIESIPHSESNNEALSPVDPGVWLHGVNGLSPSLERMCHDWFGMQVHTDINENTTYDFYIINENLQNFADLKSGKLFDRLQENITQKDASKQLRFIVLCKAASSANILKSLPGLGETERNVIIISQPCGPRKLAKALSRCIQSEPDSLRVQTSAVEPEQPGFKPDGAKESNLNDLETKPLVVSTSTKSNTDSIPSGSSFKMELAPQPAELERNETKKSIADDTAMEYGSGPFLLVDDNHINLRVLSMYVKKLKLPFTIALDGLQALEIFKTAATPYKTIFMDISMPVMDGLASTRAIRAFELDNNMSPCTIIVLTGLGSASVRQEAYASGANMMLTKPVKLKELGEILKNSHEADLQKQGH